MPVYDKGMKNLISIEIGFAFLGSVAAFQTPAIYNHRCANFGLERIDKASLTTLYAESSNAKQDSRRKFMTLIATCAGVSLMTDSAFAAPAVQDSLDIQNFLRTGVDGGGNMGVSSQAGKSRPETGVIFRDGSEVSRDARSGSVLAEILVGTKVNPTAILASFSSPWPLATGPVFDVECRDGKTGDGAFLAVSPVVDSGAKSVFDVPTPFLFERLFSPTGRFSFYGPPTDIKVIKSYPSKTNNKVRMVEVSFSSLSQSTGAEIPRHALIAATMPEGTKNVVMLVASASGSRWQKSAIKETIVNTAESFQAVPAPKSNLKIRAKPRGGELDLS